MSVSICATRLVRVVEPATSRLGARRRIKESNSNNSATIALPPRTRMILAAPTVVDHSQQRQQWLPPTVSIPLMTMSMVSCKLQRLALVGRPSNALDLLPFHCAVVTRSRASDSRSKRRAPTRAASFSCAAVRAVSNVITLNGPTTRCR
jgi:hypothetical protein